MSFSFNFHKIYLFFQFAFIFHFFFPQLSLPMFKTVSMKGVFFLNLICYIFVVKHPKSQHRNFQITTILIKPSSRYCTIIVKFIWRESVLLVWLTQNWTSGNRGRPTSCGGCEPRLQKLALMPVGFLAIKPSVALYPFVRWSLCLHAMGQ